MNLSSQDLIFLYGQKTIELEIIVKQFNILKGNVNDPVWLTKQFQFLDKIKKQENDLKEKEDKLIKKQGVILKDVSKDAKTD